MSRAFVRSSIVLGCLVLSCGGGSSPVPGDVPDGVQADVDVVTSMEIVFDTGHDSVTETADTTGEGGDVNPGEVEGDAAGDLAGEGGGDVPTDVPAEAEVNPNCPGPAGCPCKDSIDCFSGVCVDSVEGLVCSTLCNNGETCPKGWRCAQIGSGGGQDVNFGCVNDFASLCRPCGLDADCALSSGTLKNLCVAFGDSGSFCGVQCDDSTMCPDGYTCDEVAANRATVKQCRPADGAECPCYAKYKDKGYVTNCQVGNEFGKCPGTRTCDKECDGRTPAAETCNGVDDDCNGLTDANDTKARQEGLLTADQPNCEKQDGVCAGSRKPASLCVGGSWQPCTDKDYKAYSADYEAGVEVRCDGRDNDCDGNTDEDFTTYEPDNTKLVGAGHACGKGICAGGTTECTPDRLGIECSTASKASPELCDGKDNDCDGLVDAQDLNAMVDGFFPEDQPPCGLQDGVCAGARHAAMDCVGGIWGACTLADYVANDAAYQSPYESLCDDLDNNCDGQTDELLNRSCYEGGVGTQGIGECHAGVQTCVAGSWGAGCPGQVVPTPEACDGLDNDCNGKTDADDVKAVDAGGYFYADHPLCDMQSGVCFGAKHQAADCVAGSWAACTALDYFAFNPKYEPVIEATCDNLDNNCDGQTDETLDQHCYGGPKGTEDVGECHGGTQTCAAGSWGATCPGEVTPAAETCDGKDNNCNGLVDADDAGAIDTQGYFYSDHPLCEVQVGVCAGAKHQAVDCQAGSWGGCTTADYVANNSGYQAGSETVCDNKDNNCNGAIDDNVTEPCYTGTAATRHVGRCHDGVKTCAAGAWGACVGEQLPAAETCNALDDDCDGVIDNGVIRACYEGPAGTAGVGQCHTGTQTCVYGGWNTDCPGQVMPVVETCDNKDNDCDGVTDNGLTRSCYDGAAGTAGVGVCKTGLQTCAAGSWGTTCPGEVTPTVEVCDNKDNNCNGQVDEALTQGCYSGPRGTAGVGECKSGTQTCLAGAWGATCPGEVVPAPEICDTKDNDCNGLADTDDAAAIDALGFFYSDRPACDNVKGVCLGAKHHAVDCSHGAWGGCTTADYLANNPAYEAGTESACDNKDNNCNGSTDETLLRSCYDGPTGSSGVGECKAGTQTCLAGSWGTTCPGEVTPASEVCDGKDNDCNGKIDAADTAAIDSLGYFYLDRTLCDNQRGVCAGAPHRAVDCAGGHWTAVCSIADYQAFSTAYQANAETLCDNKDNDCDGVIDDGVTEACYTGPQATQGVGRCRNGTATCAAGAWGSCVGQVLPTTETCNNIDDNCNGSVDESVTQACYTGPAGTAGVGPCHGGTQTCGAGAWGACAGQVVPTTELCDNLDNNCNGAIDEGVTQACYTGPAGTQNVGICHGGTQTCAAGGWGTCTGQVGPGTEVCNGLDDDCDHAADDHPTCDGKCPAAPNATLVCGAGGTCTYTCNSNWSDCNADMADGCEFLLNQTCFYPAMPPGIEGSAGVLSCTSNITVCK